MKFKAGDKVEIVSKKHGHGFNIGEVVEVLLARDGSKDYRTQSIINGSKWWVKDDEIKSLNQTIIIHQKGNEVIATIKEGKNVIRTKKATCNPSDTFDFEVGAKLAFGRLMGLEASEAKPIVKKVKRPAKVGEWIEIVDAVEPCRQYKNGSIFQVEAMRSNSTVIDKPYWVATREYLVLENYTPEAKPFRKAKVGDKIKIVKVRTYDSHGPEVKIGDEFIVSGIIGNNVRCRPKSGFFGCNVFRDSDEEYIIIEEAKPVKRVNRKAEIGEWVELTRVIQGGICNKGEIKQVKADYDHCVGIDGTQRKCSLGDGFWAIFTDDYIVLENYKEESCQTKSY